ncbi:Beta-1,4-galactosyltransferase family and Galactosyltransferase, C-terminal domain and Galactosyltransferase, N-terminal domain-containing protein [Strongyloides ratti]|uniref:Beta-1,4-N-acetylgalactosaminyltransferase n=1 Tax=Strongyloides ratti TaxID=34506 RepID=A0A090KVS8_STRRB|nr:Beta-1,4-galactosyltransferase family and Galactosyltransferase, C-terminal domain and Galactosyltransferase, N-terminal domain-containing protein [Strongyloides ratti]CEF59981.1 Beta-1,4-galactosyltransferase family and Galactosyltransferase, C-terminal domain and Galactosyltransferase, N-terminal domain-containing protein [Strongyloides ratti]
MYIIRRRFAFIQISILKKILIFIGGTVFLYLILVNIYFPNYFSNSSDHILIVNKIISQQQENIGSIKDISNVIESNQIKYENKINYSILSSYDRKKNKTKIKGSIMNSIKEKYIKLKKIELKKCLSIDELQITGKIGQGLLLLEELTLEEVQLVHKDINIGGSWKPNDCIPLSKVAIVIPYRDRESHLTRIIAFLIPILQKQKLDFRFIVTEQIGDDLFNKGRIMNAAFIYAESLNVNCVIFHDVDMFPQDYRTPYNCPQTPRHLGAYVNNLGYQLWYPEIVGGVLAININDYRKVNGYSNMYWAWGGEDDDMGKRIMSNNYTIERPNPDIAKYSMLKHVKRKRTAPKLIYNLLKNAAERWPIDGLNETNKWKIENITIKPLYHHLFVNVFEPPKEWRPTTF